MRRTVWKRNIPQGIWLYSVPGKKAIRPVRPSWGGEFDLCLWGEEIEPEVLGIKYPFVRRPTHVFARMQQFQGKDLAFECEWFTKKDFKSSVVFSKVYIKTGV